MITLVSQGTIAASGSPAFGAATGTGHLLVAWAGSNGGTASFTTTTSTPGWTLAVFGGQGFGWSSIWYKPNSAGADAAPVFTDSAGSVEFSQLAEFSGVALSSPADQSAGVLTGPGAAAWEAVLSPDNTPGDLVVAGGFWNGANAGSVISVTQFTDSAGVAIGPNLQQASSGSQYLASMWGVTSGTGSAGDVAWMQMTLFDGGCGTAVSFSPASPVTGPLAVAPQALPVTWLDFPYVTQVFLATGGKPPYTWAVSSGSLPPGMSLSPAGVLSGSSVTSAGTFSFTVQVTDGNSNTATAAQSVTVNPPPPGFPTLSTASGQNVALPPGGAYSDPAICPASNGFNTYVEANWVLPTGSYAQSIGAYSPSVFYVAADGAPPGTGQVQAGPGYAQQWTDWNGSTLTGQWGGGALNTPLTAFSSLTATFDTTNPGTGSYELEFDLWTGYTTTNVPGTGTPQDVMIWMYTTPERAIGNNAPLWQPDVQVSGLMFDVYGTPFGGEIIFVLQGPGGTGTYAQMASGTIDILGPLLWCQANGINLGDPPVLTLIYFGWEICNTDTYLGSGVTTTENFICNSFTYNWSMAAGAPPAPAFRRAGQAASAR